MSTAIPNAIKLRTCSPLSFRFRFAVTKAASGKVETHRTHTHQTKAKIQEKKSHFQEYASPESYLATRVSLRYNLPAINRFQLWKARETAL